MYSDALEKILRDHCTPAVVRAIEAGGDFAPLWNTIADAGFLDVCVAEDRGGAELPLPEQFPLLVLLGRYAVPLPVAQTMVARALLDEAPAGLLTLSSAVVQVADGWRCPQVPFGAIADHVLADDGEALLLFRCGERNRQPAGVYRSQTATLVFARDEPPVRFARPHDNAHAAYGAAIHAAMMFGAMHVALEMTLRHSGDRQQFGRSISKFQVIQHHLATMAEHVAGARVAAETAFQSAGRTPAYLPCAAAKAKASEVAAPVSAIAHAVHGAIGVTQEHDLQLFTRRLHEWRQLHGSEHHWNAVLGNAMIVRGLPIVEFVRGLSQPALRQAV